MDAFTRLFTDGNVLIKVVLLQVAAAFFVLFLLKKILVRELFACAMENLFSFPADQSTEVDEVVVVAAQRLSGDQESRLRKVIKARFPRAEVILGQDRALWGGIVVRAGDHVFDFSLWTKISQLFKRSDL